MEHLLILIEKIIDRLIPLAVILKVVSLLS
uniref:Uncharacterized protein n=1 Tax=Podoviridae sp. ctrTt13 TaxID=2825279 RepID=A0A8S5NSQ4_9CAUD|nr:MAG TPA: hypothetical protein [Podoviridae sp. ctrTt13]